jgi:threonyl-tRNA synthetase
MFRIHQNSFSRILAAAIIEVLPGAEIAQVGLSYNGFFCNFTFFSPMSGELLVRLEERMRQIIREKREIRVLEMVPFSASELLKKQGQKKRAAQVLEQEGLVRLVRMDPFVDWCEEEGHMSHTGQAGVFRLLESTPGERCHFRIFGITAPSKKELKEEVLKWTRFPEMAHDRAGADQGLWTVSEGHRIWLARGLAVRERWSSFWKKAFAPSAPEIEGGQEIREQLASLAPSSLELTRFEDLDCPADDRGLLNQPFPLALQINHFIDPLASCISFLQTIDKSLSISGFTYRIRYLGRKRKGCPIGKALEQLGWKADEEKKDDDPKLEFLVEDALQCEWAVAEIRELKLKSIKLLSASVWIERNLALLLERSDGNLPHWLAPEHLRILPVSAGQAQAAQSEAQFFQEQGIRAVSGEMTEETLSERIRRAERERVPFLVILGDREIETGHLTWRQRGKGQETGERERLRVLLRMTSGELIENK